MSYFFILNRCGVLSCLLGVACFGVLVNACHSASASFATYAIVPQTSEASARPATSSEQPNQQDPLQATAENPITETVVSGLSNPNGLAIQPETETLFVADSGNHKIIRIVGGKPEDVVTGFPAGVLDSSNGATGGPLGLAFLDKNTLIVGGASSETESGRLYVFKIGEPGSEPLDAAKATKALEIKADGDQPALGSFYGVCVTAVGVLATTQGDPAQGWIAKAAITENDLESVSRFVGTFKDMNALNPRALVLSPEGYLAIGNAGENVETPDSVLAFYDQDGEFLDRFPLGLRDVAGLAYSPLRKRLFAIDYSVAAMDQGGLFKIVSSETAESRCEARLIQRLHRPSALVFDAQGNLYVAQSSAPDAETEVASGSVIKIIGLDLPPSKTPADSNQIPSGAKEAAGG